MSVVIGELNEARVVQALGGKLADITYSDPPWGPGIMKTFHKAAGSQPSQDWSTFIREWCRLVDKYTKKDGHIFVEMGLQWVDELAYTMAALGRPETHRCTVFYASPPLPNALWYSGPGQPTMPEGLSGVKVVTTALERVATPGALVLDPCCGLGMTARCAVRLGMRFAGVELNPKRAAKTIDWLQRHAPELV